MRREVSYFKQAEEITELAKKGEMVNDGVELQTLQGALKGEIQVHQNLVAQIKKDSQNDDFKKQLHEFQAKITVLSEKQM